MQTDPPVADFDDVTDPYAPEDDAPLSILEQLEREAEDAAEAVAGASLKLLVPAWKSLYVGFHYVPRSTLTKNRKKYKGKPMHEVELLASADTLVGACAGLFVSTDDGETYQPLHEAIGVADVIRFDDVLRTKVLKLPAIVNARTTLMELYRNDYAIVDHAEQVTSWLKDTSKKGEDELLGG